MSRHSGIATPYKWEITKGGGWRIGFGASGFLIAQGSGFSRAHGASLYRELEGKWKKRKKAQRPVRNKV